MTGKIEFQVNMQRMLETVCWFANRDTGKELTIHSLMKLLFFADVEHLNKYYVPIFGGHYMAMKYGPVHYELYNTIKNNYPPILETGIELPFDVIGHHVKAHRPPNLMKFSDDNERYLEMSWQEHSGKNFMELTNESHEYKAWEKAWEASSLGNEIMDYRDFFNDDADQSILEDLCTYGRAIAV